MSAVVLLVVVGLVVAWRLRKRRRQSLLSGTVAERPLFQVDPPRRRMNPRREELL